MMLRKLLKILFGLFIVIVIVVALTSINHPIILKWITGSAKHHGSSMNAKIYANGVLDPKIKLYYSDKPQSYLLCLAEYDSSGPLRFIHIDLGEKWLGRPAAMSKKDYDLIAGHLFQSETGARFTSFQNDIKGFNFDPQLSFDGKEIKFNLPPNKLKFDSLRIMIH